jgi:hypothetical protein
MGRSKRKLLKKKRTKKYKKQKGGDKHKLIMKLVGGLGNRFFQIMAGYGFAEKWNMELYVNNASNNHVDKESSQKDVEFLFPNLKFITDMINEKSYNKIYEQTEFIYNDINKPNNDTILSGYFQSEKYFPKDLSILNVPSKDESKDLIFIHFRLGEYLILNNIKKYIKNYYLNCIEKINAKVKNIKYLIVSNDIEEAKKYIYNNLAPVLNDNNIILDDSKNRLETLRQMGECKGGICINSTFSWMGAYFIKNKDKDLIFMPNPWMEQFDINENIDIHPEWATKINLNNNK